MKDSYYADTAYDSSKIKELPAPDNSKFSFTTRKLRRHPLSRYLSAQCREFLAIDYIQVIKLLNSDDEEVKKDIASPGHEMQPWETLRNPKVAVNTLTQVMRFFSIIGWFFYLVALAMGIFSWSELDRFPSTILKIRYFVSFYSKVMIFPMVPTVIYWIGNVILKKNMVEDKYNKVLSRRKGTIFIPRKGNLTHELPFEEFDPYLNLSAHSSGRICYHLCLCHRYSEEWISCPDEQEDEWGVYQLWEYWQQYMDISKPLPDVPKMEPYRSRDPVTAAYDKKHNRPKDYWKNMDMAKADKMQDEAIDAAKQYPWDLDRKWALASGWQPSGYGEGDWQQDTQSEKQAQQADAI